MLNSYPDKFYKSILQYENRFVIIFYFSAICFSLCSDIATFKGIGFYKQLSPGEWSQAVASNVGIPPP